MIECLFIVVIFQGEGLRRGQTLLVLRVELLVLLELLLHGLDRGGVADALLAAALLEVVLRLVLALYYGLLTLLQGLLPPQELPPVLVELLYPVERKHNAILLLDLLILCP